MNKDALSPRSLARIATFAAVTAVMAQIAFPLPFTPIPLSFGLVAVYTTGILLKPWQAVYAQICYLALGAAGLPLFGKFHGGIATLLGPTGGFLMMYPIAAWIVSYTLNGRQHRQGKTFLVLKSSLALCVALIVLYTGGTAWLCLTARTPLPAALSLAVFPFIPLDIGKIVLCLCAVLPLRQRIKMIGSE